MLCPRIPLLKKKLRFLKIVAVSFCNQVGFSIFADVIGELAEWLKALAWKACIPQKGIKGSNPLLSARYRGILFSSI